MMRIEPVVVRAEVPEVPAVTAVDPTLLTDLQAERGQALFGFARRLGLTDDQAADAVQETLLRLWRELRRGTEIKDAGAWAFRTLYRIAMDEHRLRRRVVGLMGRLAGRDTTAPAPGDRAERIAVWAEVDRLPTRQRHVLYLRYRADLPFDQVAAVLGISAGAARTHCSRALDRLRDRFAAPDGGD